MNGLKIIEELKAKGFAVADGETMDDSSCQWEVFGVWFYLRQDFHFDLDRRKGKFYMYLDSGRDAAKAKEPKNKTLESYSAEEFLSDNLLKHFNTLSDISKTIEKDGFYVTDDLSVIKLMDEEDNRCVFYWITSEPRDVGTIGFVNKEIPLMYLSTYPNQDAIFEDAKARGLKPYKEKFDENDDDKYAMMKLEGFEELDFMV